MIITSIFFSERLYNGLVKQCKQDFLYSDVYEFSKHTKTSYSSINNKSLIPFMTIDYDAHAHVKLCHCLAIYDFYFFFNWFFFCCRMT